MHKAISLKPPSTGHRPLLLDRERERARGGRVGLSFCMLNLISFVSLLARHLQNEIITKCVFLSRCLIWFPIFLFFSALLLLLFLSLQFDFGNVFACLVFFAVSCLIPCSYSWLHLGQRFPRAYHLLHQSSQRGKVGGWRELGGISFAIFHFILVFWFNAHFFCALFTLSLPLLPLRISFHLPFVFAFLNHFWVS